MAADPDPNAEDLTYTLGGADAAKFRVRANGQIEVGSGTMLDYETKTDLHGDGHGRGLLRGLRLHRRHHHGHPRGRSTGRVWSGGHSEYAENGTGAVATYTAMDPELDGDHVLVSGRHRCWSLHYRGRRADASRSLPTTRRRADVAWHRTRPQPQLTTTSYEITVKAMDSTGKTGEKAVTVDVTDVDEPGAVTLSALRPQVSVVFTASLTDLDGDVKQPASRGSGPSPAARTARTPTSKAPSRHLRRRPMPVGKSDIVTTTCGRRRATPTARAPARLP